MARKDYCVALLCGVQCNAISVVNTVCSLVIFFAFIDDSRLSFMYALLDMLTSLPSRYLTHVLSQVTWTQRYLYYFGVELSHMYLTNHHFQTKSLSPSDKAAIHQLGLTLTGPVPRKGVRRHLLSHKW